MAGYGEITNPNRRENDSRLEWQPNGVLMFWTREFDNKVAVPGEVDVERVTEWLENNPRHTSFDFINAISPAACNWVMVQQKNGKLLTDSQYTSYLWGVTDKQLVDFIKQGYVDEEN